MSQFQNVNVVRTAPQMKEIGKMLTSLATSYKECNMFSVKNSTKQTAKGVQKEFWGKTSLVRGATKSRIEADLKESVYSQTYQADTYLKKVHFSGFNVFGNIVGVSMFFSQRLSSDKSYFQTDASQFGFAAILYHLTINSSNFIIDKDNVDNQGNVFVLKGLEEFALAQDDSARNDAILLLFQYFVVNVFDQASAIVGSMMMNEITKVGGNLGSYNSDPNFRQQIATYIQTHIPQIADYLGDMNLLTNAYNEVPRSEWLNRKSAPKKKSETNHISLTELPKVAREIGVLSDVVASLPPKYRKEHNGVTHYVNIEGLNSNNAHKLWYVTGISYKASTIDSSPSTQMTEGGKRRTKILNHSEAKARIIKNITKYFYNSSCSSDKKQNIVQLAEKIKFLDITGTNFTTGTGPHIAAKTTNTVFLFPGERVPNYASKDDFLNNHAAVFQFVKCCLGYNSSKSQECDYNYVINLVKELYKVFGLDAPTNIFVNNVSSKGGSSNAFASTGFSPSQVNHQQSMFSQNQQQSMFNQNSMADQGDEM